MIFSVVNRKLYLRPFLQCPVEVNGNLTSEILPVKNPLYNRRLTVNGHLTRQCKNRP